MISIRAVHRSDFTKLPDQIRCDVGTFFIRVQKITGKKNKIRGLGLNSCDKASIVRTKLTVV